MEHCKLQIACMLIILYILFIYCKECKRYGRKDKFSMFDALLAVGIFSVFFDGVTAYTVNHLGQVNETANMIFHLCFLVGLDCFIFRLFVYMLSITAGLPKKKSGVWLMYLPLIVNVALVVINIPNLQYIEGEVSNYSMGMSAYTCFVMAAIYILASIVIFFSRWRYIERHKLPFIRCCIPRRCLPAFAPL